MTLALYRCPRIGTGIPPDAYRSKIASTIDGTNGTFEDWALDPGGATGRYVLASCAPAVHAVLVADPEIMQMSPQVADTAALGVWLDGAIGTVAAALRNAIESDGIPIDDFTVSSTRREVWRRIAMRHRIGQLMLGEGDGNALAFLVANLATQVSALTAAVRNRASAWMSERGIDASWIVGTTTVREVLRFIFVNNGFQRLRFARIDI